VSVASGPGAGRDVATPFGGGTPAGTAPGASPGRSADPGSSAHGWSRVDGQEADVVPTRFVVRSSAIVLERVTAPTLTLGVEDITKIDEVGPVAAAAGVSVVELHLRDGRRVTVGWPTQFSDEVSHRLAGPDVAGTVVGLRHGPWVDSAQRRTEPVPTVPPTATAPPSTPVFPAVPGTPGAESHSSRRTRSGRLLVLVLVIGLLALAAVSVLLHQRGTGWQERALAAEASVAELRADLGRTQEELTATRGLLDTANARVAELERRTTELTNEKGQIQDERNRWMQVSQLGAQSVDALQQCMSDISTAMDGLFDDGTSYAAYSVMLSRARASCSAAGNKVDEFAGAYAAS
jgi:Tfp pilus assembly protein PilX